jgi:hypothetical protein
MAYIVLRVLNVHAPSEERSDDSKHSSYEELEQVFNRFPKYHTKLLLPDFNAKVGRERVFSIRQLGMTAYMTIVILMVLE